MLKDVGRHLFVVGINNIHIYIYICVHIYFNLNSSTLNRTRESFSFSQEAKVTRQYTFRLERNTLHHGINKRVTSVLSYRMDTCYFLESFALGATIPHKREMPYKNMYVITERKRIKCTHTHTHDSFPRRCKSHMMVEKKNQSSLSLSPPH